MFGSRVVDASEHGSVRLNNGQNLSGDVIIGADGTHDSPRQVTSANKLLGINSTLRSIVLGEDKKATPTGDVAYRATIPKSELAKDPALVERFQHAGSSIWWGPNKHAFFYPIQNCECFNLVLL